MRRDAARHGLVLPLPDFSAASLPEPKEVTDPIRALDIKERGISTILWANGSRCDFSWVHFPIFANGPWPKHIRGTTSVPGLYFWPALAAQVEVCLPVRRGRGCRASCGRSRPIRASDLLQKSAIGRARRGETGSWLPCAPRGRRLRRTDTNARDAQATQAEVCGGDLATNFARRRRFWAMAARVNSSCAPRGPRNRRRPSLRMRLRWANSISTRLRSRHDCSKASVLAVLAPRRGRPRRPRAPPCVRARSGRCLPA